MYPVLIVLTVLRLFRSKIHDVYVYRWAAGITAAISLMSTLSSLTGRSFGMERLPLADLGFEWFLPALIVTAAALIVSNSGHGLHRH